MRIAAYCLYFGGFKYILELGHAVSAVPYGGVFTARVLQELRSEVNHRLQLRRR